MVVVHFGTCAKSVWPRLIVGHVWKVRMVILMMYISFLQPQGDQRARDRPLAFLVAISSGRAPFPDNTCKPCLTCARFSHLRKVLLTAFQFQTHAQYPHESGSLDFLHAVPIVLTSHAVRWFSWYQLCLAAVHSRTRVQNSFCFFLPSAYVNCVWLPVFHGVFFIQEHVRNVSR